MKQIGKLLAGVGLMAMLATSAFAGSSYGFSFNYNSGYRPYCAPRYYGGGYYGNAYCAPPAYYYAPPVAYRYYYAPPTYYYYGGGYYCR